MKTIKIVVPEGCGERNDRHFGTIEVEDLVYVWLTNLTEKIPMSEFRFVPVHYDQDNMTAYLTPEPIKGTTKHTISVNLCQHYFQPVLCNKVEQVGKGLRTETQECVGAICTKCGKFKKENPSE